ncbi:hypothetical protein T440DRAFT_324557 [Plenodomus tracheiphilus IPT5]|uniref:Uncharacterized protein n=1 Tax=Plenodomus tracheiphilus IPT5 TaxID=1408161 RepID=A0A6A7BD28_9PLEO|nr:hypothetical protein T440DRAFT_324557 [Plenodomus tracheiphilus IPT5]
MTPRTRSGNQDADPKVYSSKHVPHQLHFPHKRKTVHRPSSPVRGDSGKRQMVFVPEKMKPRPAHAVRDSDEETDHEQVETKGPTANEQNTYGQTSRSHARKGKKRGRLTRLEVGSDEEKPPPSTAKRQRAAAATPNPERTLRRQSTMTQLVDGRRPLSDAEEPGFKPVKRDSRTSWGGKGHCRGRDKQQRTLTQMIPGMRPLEIMSDEDIEGALSDVEAQDSDSQAYDLAVAQRLAVQRHLQDVRPDVSIEREPGYAPQSIPDLGDGGLEGSEVVVHSVDDAADDHAGHGSYRPTQYIDAPSSRLRGTARPSPDMESAGMTSSVASTPMARRLQKPRFSLLNTPERRRIREIPSSQSPTESPLSAQVSPQKLSRPPLHESSGNSGRALATPSNRKRVAFKESYAPPALKKFESTIQDSEDEDDGIEENMFAPIIPRRRTGLSPELGDLHAIGRSIRNTAGAQAPNMRELPLDHGNDAATLPLPTPQSQPNEEDIDTPAVTSIEAPIPNSTECLRSTPPSNETVYQETFPSTPMVIQNESSDEELDEGLTPLHQSSQHVLEPDSLDIQHTADLDGEPIQVPRSPSAQRDTQQSHSSKAEQQLQSEWFSYSQYVNTQPPTSSSMFVVHDPSSYGVTQSLQRDTAPQTHSTAHPPSQATTLDEVTQRTPRTSRTQRAMSANMTPRRIASSQPVVSPSKPPPLFIPSSFPSPAKAAMQEWSSPVYGRTQDALRSSQFGMSLDDFSIPPPPPVEDDWGIEEGRHTSNGSRH